MKGLWSAVFKNRPVWHRIHIKPRDPADDKVPYLAQIRRRVLFIYLKWNWVDNSRRAAIQDAVELWQKFEKAMANIRQLEKENEEAVNSVMHNRPGDGVSEPVRSKRIPRQRGLIPIPPEWKDVQKMYNRATSGSSERQARRELKDVGDASWRTAFIPPGANLPDIVLDGKDFKFHEWDVKRNQQDGNQGKKRGRNKGGNDNQNQQGGPQVMQITLPD